MKTVLIFGSFDIIHDGHRSVFAQAKALGDKLVVLLARDETIAKHKGRKPFYNERERMEHVLDEQLVDEVLLGDKDNRYAFFETLVPDVIALGYDQNLFVDRLEQKIAELGYQIVIHRLVPHQPELYKSSKLRLARELEPAV